MRTIKFRAYDKENNCWFEPTYEAYKGNLEDLSISMSGELDLRTLENGKQEFTHESRFPNRFEIQQFTGLLDKNKKEVYDQDLMKSKNALYKVFWDEDGARWQLAYISGNVSPINKSLGWGVKYCEVVGNSFENPELLEGKEK